MNLISRRKTRAIAHFILAHLDEPGLMLSLDIYSHDPFGEIWTRAIFARRYPKYTLEHFTKALNLLEQNRHISNIPFEENRGVDLEHRLVRTTLGTDAYLDRFYERENTLDTYTSIKRLAKSFDPLPALLRTKH